MNGRIGLVDRGRSAGAVRRNGNGNGNGRKPVVTNAERERARTIPAVQEAFNIAARRENRFGDDVSDLKTMLDEPLWSRFEITADGATAVGPKITFFANPTGDGIDQSRFINNRQLEGSLAFKILAVSLAIQGRAGQTNFNLLQFNAALFGSIANETVFNFPLEAGMLQETERAAFAADASAGPVSLQSTTGVQPYGWEMSTVRPLYWPPNLQMTWTLEFNGPIIFATPPDETDDFVISLVLYGYKSQDMVG
jgi:hypothetical protein